MSSIVPTELTDAHWRALHELAVGAMTYVYAPYFRFKVDVAALVDDGRLVPGYNVESAGCGVTLRTEYGLISKLTRTGGGRLVVFACVDAHDQALAPYGRCRQLPSKHATDDIVLAMPSGMMGVDEALPGRFCANDIERVVGPQS